MYRPGADTPPFRPVPAAPPPPRMMGGTYVSPSIPPLLHPSIHPSAQARVPVMQQYSYPPPVPSPAPAHQPLLPPPGPSGLPFATIRQTLPSMQQPLPLFQRPLPGMHPSGPPTNHMLHPSLPRFQPVPPPPPLQANYQSSLPSVRPAPIPVPPSLPQVQPPLAFGPPPLPSVQQEPFLPPLPATPPSENPPPPPPASPPPQSPQAYTVNPSGDSLRPESPKVAYNQDNLKLAALLPPEPPKPADPEMIKNINVLAAFVVKNGPRFESMARARQAGDPKFAFLFESDGAPEAAIGHEYYKWKKQNIAVELGLEIENKKVDLGTGFGRSFHEKDLPSVSNERLASPAISDMDMEDDFAVSPAEVRLGPGTSDAKGHADSNTSIERDLSPKQGGVPVTGITGSIPTSHDQAPLPEASAKKGPGARTSWDDAGEARRPLPVGPIDSTTEWEPNQHVLGMKSEDGDAPPGRRIGRPTRWENVSSSSHSVQSVAENKPAEMDDGQIDKGNLSSRHGDSFVGLVKTKEGGKEEKPEDGTLTATLSLQPNEEAANVDEFGRLVRKDSVASDSEEDQRPRKRRRSHSRSRSRSDSRGRSRGRGRSRSRSRGRSRSRSRGRVRSRSSSHSSGESRWRRNRSPLRRARWSRSRSRSPIWQRNYSRSPQRRGDRDWRDERESYGRGRRMGRGSGPSLCFHFARGRCFRGNACKFLHPERENGQDHGLHARDVPMDRPEPTASQEMEPSWQGVSDLHSVDGNKKDDVAQRMGSTNGRDFSNDGVQHPVGIDQTEEIEHYKDAHGVSPVDVTQVASTEGLNLEQQSVHIDKSADGQGVEAATDLSAEEKLCLDRKVQPDGQSKSEEVLSEGLKVSENVGEDMGSVQNTTMSLSGDLAVRMSDVGGDDDGIEGPKSPLLSRAPPPPGLVSSAIPLSAANVTVGLLPNQYMLAEQRHLTAFDSSSPFSAGVAQPSARPPAHGASTSPNMGFSVGSFNPPHLASRPPFPTSSKSHSSIPSASMHGTQPYLHNIRPLSQSSHLSPISSELDPTPNTAVGPRGHHPLLREQPGFTINYALSKEDSSRMFIGDNARQYIHSEPSSDGLKHDYFRSSTITSGGSGQSSVPWKDNSLVVSSSTEQASYSYTLTTIPPLSNLIKLPSSSVLAGKADQYDPLSGGLELNLPDPFKASSGKSPGDGRPLGATFLENVSPGVDPLAHTSELDIANMNEAAADVGVVENVSPPGEWSPAPPGDAVGMGSDQLQAKSKRSSRGLKLLRSAVADRVKVLLKPSWKEGRLSKEAFKTIAKKAVEKVTGNLPSHHIPKSQEKVDQFMAISNSKISKLVQGYVDKYSSRPNG